jgi:DNA-binding LacI/PurR family transcriptional regulator
MNAMSREYDQKYQALRLLIEKQPGQRLPGERALADQLGIPRAALRGLLDILEGEGLVRRHQGSGTYAVDTQSRRLRTVVLLIDQEIKLGEDPFFSLLVEYLQGELQEQGIHCMIERIHPRWQFQHPYDGAITIGQAGNALLPNLPKSAPPVVSLLLDTSLPANASVSIFQLAEREAGGAAAQRLLSTRCRELLFLGRRDLPASRERLAGVEEVLSTSDVPFQFINCSLNYAAGLKAGREIPLSPDQSPVGIIAANDWLAVGLRAGLSSRPATTLPDIQLVSFDGLPLTADPFLGIDALVAPLQTIAADAVSELQRLRASTPGRVVRYAFHWRL